jgi:CheY-like chemotaxis protein
MNGRFGVQSRDAICYTKVIETMSGKRIMLIDDDPLCILISTKIIELNPALKVISFSNAAAALSQLKEWYVSGSEMFPDFIFLDINMPVMDGWQFLEETMKLPDGFRERCNVIMLSSSVNPIDVRKSKEYERVSDFVSKPLTVDKVQSLMFRDSDHKNSVR